MANPLRSAMQRPEVRGKFLFANGRKLWIRGATYGTFRPDEQGLQYGSAHAVDRDFASMASNGINTVRVYTAPPRWVLDSAAAHGLRIMVGLPWEQHVAFLEDERLTADILSRVRADARHCSGHPALLCYAVGNEIPSPIVRWYGAPRVERFIRKLCEAARDEDPGCLVTYVNYPTTEYLELPFIDFVSFNVYLETRDRLSSYLKRLHNLAGPRPLLMGEIGLDSLSHGTAKQAEVLDWQVRTAFESGCCGAFVFAWTDEWYRGGQDVEGWEFGLTTRDRRPKPALKAVRKVFEEVPVARGTPLPQVSVVVCSFNGAATIRETLEGLQEIDYPNLEVIVVDDGSTDSTGEIARKFPVRLIQTANGGLSSARNVGLSHATGEIVAYTDDDARPDPHWLTFTALAFRNSSYAAIGGPNIAPPGDGLTALCVANAPGGPVHVLLSDEVAEHIPGCNMAFRRDSLRAIGGFDPRFRTAGDDVDVCWRLQAKGWTIGFSPSAMVWHHPRNTVRAYWRQQVGYGYAEALLEEKWPEKYNGAGHLTWRGRMYGEGLTRPLRLGRGRVYQGTWGTAPFQSVYEPAPALLRFLPKMPEWYLATALLAGLAPLGLLWPVLGMSLVPLALAVALPAAQAVASAGAALAGKHCGSQTEKLKALALTSMLHLIQPAARLIGRLRGGLTPWRRGRRALTFPRSRKTAVWSEEWRAPETWLADVEAALRREKASLARGGDFDRWDLTVRGGLFGRARLLIAIEEHGAGQQYVRFRVWPSCATSGVAAAAVLVSLGSGAALGKAGALAGLSGAACIVVVAVILYECSVSETALLGAISKIEPVAPAVAGHEPRRPSRPYLLARWGLRRPRS